MEELRSVRIAVEGDLTLHDQTPTRNHRKRELFFVLKLQITYLHFFVAAHTKPPQPCRTRNNILAAKRKLKR
uniref:Uncharacterized protein n=1 Tax=Trichogramma kaykai TaxID=54128 RepID=A0ABD2X969_9HYME